MNILSGNCMVPKDLINPINFFSLPSLAGKFPSSLEVGGSIP